MKYFVTLLIGCIIALALITIGCGPHFLGKPEPYHPEPAKPVAVEAPAPVTSPPQTINITIPNWPVYGYAIDGAFVVLVVRDPATFPVPEQFVFIDKNQTQTTLPMIKPQEEKKP